MYPNLRPSNPWPLIPSQLHTVTEHCRGLPSLHQSLTGNLCGHRLDKLRLDIQNEADLRYIYLHLLKAINTTLAYKGVSQQLQFTH